MESIGFYVVRGERKEKARGVAAFAIEGKRKGILNRRGALASFIRGILSCLGGFGTQGYVTQI